MRRAGAWTLAAALLIAAQGAGAQQQPAAADPAPAANDGVISIETGNGGSVSGAPEALPPGMPALPDTQTETGMQADDGQQPAQQTLDPKTLADMRAQLAAIGRALQSLRAELVASGPAGFTAAGGAPAIERMDQMEAQIASLTGAVEEMRNRVEGSIAQATNRAGDIEFRLCEMDPSCDLGALTTAQLDDAAAAGGGTGAAAPAPAPGPAATAPEIPEAPPTGTPAENADFDRAAATLTAGDNARAAELFAAFAADHPASTMVPEAMFMRGQALAAAGDSRGAAAAWLETFAAAPTGPKAPQALLAVAGAMADSGKTDEACVFYADVPVRFPATPAAMEAMTRSEALRCAPAADPAAPAAAGGAASPEAGAMDDPEAAGDLADVGG